MISCCPYKVKRVTSFVLLRLSMNHFILLVSTLLLCPSSTSYPSYCNCTVAEAIPHPHQSLLWRYDFFLTRLLPPSLLSSLPGQPPCFMVRVINNTSSVHPHLFESRLPGPRPIRTEPETQGFEWYTDNIGVVKDLSYVGTAGLSWSIPAVVISCVYITHCGTNDSIGKT